jgi:cytochrome c oxidase subunit 2
MKIIVDTPEDYRAWLKEQTTIVSEVKAAMAEPAAVDGTSSSDSTKAKDTAMVAVTAMK